MDPFNGVSVNKVDGGLGRVNPSLDGTALLVIESTVAPSGIALNEVTRLLSVKEAEENGITAAYDDTNDVLAHYHIDEAFRINPDIYLFVLFLEDISDYSAINAAIRETEIVRIVGICENKTAAPLTDLATKVPAYQANVVDELASEKLRIDAVLVSGEITDDTAAISTYPTLRDLDSENVSVIIGTDKAIADASAVLSNAAIGTAIGGLSRRAVDENLGSVDIANKPDYAKGQNYFSLTDLVKGKFVQAQLQAGQLITALNSAERKDLNDKGYIFVGYYAGFQGYYFSNSCTSTELSSDYCYIENNRVWNKAARGIRQALLPRVKSSILKERETGYIRNTEAKDLEQLAAAPLEAMMAADEISGYEVVIDRTQILIDETPLKVAGQIVANGVVFSFEFDLGLTDKID
jgi:hypothetical protein